jgi:hypothetical protein
MILGFGFGGSSAKTKRNNDATLFPKHTNEKKAKKSKIEQ